MTENNFQDISPYTDEDVKNVLPGMVQDPGFLKLAQSINPNITREMLMSQVNHVNTILGFQKQFITPIVDSVLHKSIDNLTFSGLENISKNKAYLYLSNHRDIILDSTLINYILIKNGYNSTEMAIGDNLLLQPWITDFFKLNKSFIVKRGLPGRELLKASKKLSQYIAYTLKEKKESIWIAQREGRTKDGHDETQPGLLKMFAMAASKNFRERIRSLNIVPVAISYQYEPCDRLKAKELYKKEEGEFKKGPKSDLYSMLTGIRQYKGNVHIAIGKTLTGEIEKLDSSLQKNDFFKAVTELIDENIYHQYRLWNTNYIAWDIKNDSCRYRDNYTPEEKENFIAYLDKTSEKISPIRDYLLAMYAGPVTTCQSVS
ncbi:MAG: 1-acyl-sn-glycerol-3-phosphate acyltransferase [Fidelibacterota bacterium]